MTLTPEVVATIAAEARAEREKKDQQRIERGKAFRDFCTTNLELLGIERLWDGRGAQPNPKQRHTYNFGGKSACHADSVHVHLRDEKGHDIKQVEITLEISGAITIGTYHIGTNAVALATYITRSLEGLDVKGPSLQARLIRARQIGEKSYRFSSGGHEGLATAVLTLLTENPNPDRDVLEALARPFFVRSSAPA